MGEEQSKLVSEVLRQKDYVLNKNNGIGYAPIPHNIYRKLLPQLKAKYDGQTARDCLFLYGYFQANVNGQSEGSAYMWAFPNVVQIAEDTGIHKDRIKGLVDILESEGLLVSRRIPWYGHTKKMYMPFYMPRKLPDSYERE
ncbi:hypothetical protein [Bacillus sp. ISL-37]|uniref:hypothetical protein n=1 Tax=Bacillus sp. ISL-37 TaxID=2819123 RepID=UPI001BE62890|nr:hypothetical protein [Bacillus sp. ISL-37]MBT2682646.1 hypothetical protein [Bacillus sp. ISL-37]